ncbi:MAG: valine--tRNA ligase [Anderseniella sp.]|jgi:valyl-tRNA synthetase|nr:valine--tRNA ligase [Anderseniella sp.]
MLDKHYNPADIETRLYDAWEASGAFKANQRPEGDPFCIVIPPPNVTGSLHMGHALNNTIQDILCRFERMRGRDVLWQPGLDHAGIATQMVVERQMAERQEPGRRDIGREAFLEKVWTWKAESGGTIVGQLRRLGASCDWSRERFTMDDGLSAAVLKVFVQLYREGLIYKDKRLVNWDPKLLTAISDLEVVQVETQGNLWHFKYPIEGEAGRFITVATTRPETMLGDTGVAVHPDDERYRDLIGKHVILPLVGRRIPIVADDYADPEAGSGAVKITPAHDFNDFEVGKRNDLAQINIMERDASIVLDGNEDFLSGVPASDELKATIAAIHGLDRFEARKVVVAMMEERGLLEKIEPHKHMVPHGDRGGVPIEPFLTDQWYVDAATLAKPAIAAVETGDTVFVPKQWEKTYYEWMRNIQPWCISRQLWWGHQIPAWYGPDGRVFVAETENLALEEAESLYGSRVMLTRDEDVLDTWFSSALWPFSTLGWPENTHELQRYYPTNVLVTGFDIIFFWVARMMMMGLHFMKKEDGSPQVPFDTVYIHALVRDEKGQKMSKSKGNVIDPLELIDQFGADALRFTLAAMAAQGRDIKLATSRVEGYRNFGTKLWNAARFAEMNGAARVDGFDPASAKVTLNRWIAGEAARTRDAVTKAIEEHRYNEAAGALYSFIWHTFCDWYVELSKPILNGTDEAALAETRAMTAWTLDQILLLLHPFMPYITEELWQKTAGDEGRDTMLVTARWPSYEGLGDAAADAEMAFVIRLITEIRSVRAEMNVPAGAKIPCVLAHPSDESSARAKRWEAEISRLARLESLIVADAVPEASAQIVMDETVVALPLAGVIDFAAEKARLNKELDKTARDISAIEGRLNNPGFVAKAPPEVIEEAKERREELTARAGQVKDALGRLAALG